jgi:hypothetical protein
MVSCVAGAPNDPTFVRSCHLAALTPSCRVTTTISTCTTSQNTIMWPTADALYGCHVVLEPVGVHEQVF